LFVQHVRTSTVEIVARGQPPMMIGPVAAYGISAGASSQLDCTRAVIATGGFGFFDRGGSLSLTSTLITDQQVFGALGGSGTVSPNLTNVSSLGNDDDEIEINSTLPGPYESP
jgi:hypothetical protein